MSKIFSRSVGVVTLVAGAVGIVSGTMSLVTGILLVSKHRD
ncbi:hypothetical protein OEA22_06840 [Lacticaseibacillus paracasei]|uniref:Uncharacterized protein n=2 Tax=Lacticaseibacillus paracasei TaxID=1597 RepID=K0N3X9_LACPA|nr:hypothetical protein [Lacticaseibacillus paracasei]EPC32897.1 hypothetical protein Lpp223_1821 [Lacticaseibacillus paracasei subsp. paracasei Lpp223]EPC44939.1 hypothetical protein Lpp229_08301 [Lacticaseibacillus paracasei subsp. paracasei Lpp229]EPC67238.1 hypothetical protein Lpp228_07535 [Lacticaseibacillus paracasei subsp. paracasei Lpp228]ORI24502.1 hypothetical protein BLL63_09390 [Lacticaseibacillus casei]AEA53531.1 hypothetical protein LC2W_1197 [Lacticaseibacillus paracasei]